MLSWRDPYLTFSAAPEALPLLLAAEPAWIFARDGSRLFWANPAGAALLGAARFARLAERSWDAGHPLRRDLERLSRSLPDNGTLARLRLTRDFHSVPLACRCRRLRVGDLRGVLVQALDASGHAPEPEDLATFLASGDSAVTLTDLEGTVLAQAGSGDAANAESASSLEFSHSGRLLRLTLSLAAAGAEEITAPPPGDVVVDNAGLRIAPQGEAPTVAPAPASDQPPPDGDSAGQLPGAETTVDNAGLPIGPETPAQPADAPPDMAEAEPNTAKSPAEPAQTPEEAGGRSVMAGRVARELSREPVRFLWQTDAADRFLFVSPGLAQVVGRNAEVVGERWEEVAGRLHLDPGSRIVRAMAQRDTWSGQTAWWPVEGSNVRVPAELTALPIFGGDHSFQGFRGFGVLKPAEALMPAGFDARFGASDSAERKPAEQVPPYEETATAPVASAPGPAANVVPIRADLERVADQTRLTPQEFNAFEEIAAALRQRILAPDVLEIPDEREHDRMRGVAEALPAPDQGRPSPAREAPPPVVPLFRDRAVQEPPQEPPPAGTDEAQPHPVADPAPAELPAVPELVTPEPGEAAGEIDRAPVAPEAENPPEQAVPEAGTADAVGEPPQEPPAAAEAAAPPPPEPGPPDDIPPPQPPPAARQALSEGEALRRLRELTAILDTATDGVIILDGEGVVESANASAEALFGLHSDELRNMDFGELLTPESAQSALDYLSGLKDNGVASLLNEGREVLARAGSGSIPLFMTLGRISDSNGGRFCAVLRDITHWKRTEAELVSARRAAEEASNQKSEFLARVSHEIRTPLNAIIGFAEVMIEERFGPIENERYREYLRDIRTSGEHVVSLVNDLLDISKIEAGKLDLNFVAVPLNDLVRECIAMMQPQASRGRVVLRSSLSREVPGIVADHRTMRQIVLNILSNAVKFTGPGGQVIASTSLADSGEAILRIRDTGEGMSEDELARALEPFRQIATATLSDRTGTGLGLPLTKALVEANRAGLAIRSARGEGTVVTITFPPTRVLSE